MLTRAFRPAWGSILVLAIGAFAAACKEEVQVVFRDPMPPERSFFTSRHATGRGKITFYGEANGGFERFTHIP